MLELHAVRLDKDGAYLGTGLSLTEVDHNLKKYMKRLPGEFYVPSGCFRKALLKTCYKNERQ